jgi:hypothetical protein
MVRRIARIRVGERDDEGSTAYYAYIDGERYILSKNPRLLLWTAGADSYQQVFGKHGFDYIMSLPGMIGYDEGRRYTEW